MSNETSALLGDQKKTNYALGDISKEDFVKELTTGILPPPQYFSKAAAQNKSGYKSIDEVFESSLKALSAKAVSESDALVLDTRHQNDFRDGHIKGAWYVGLHGQFAPWVGALIEDLHQPIIIVADEGKEREAIMRLARVGYDNVVGYLAGGMDSWIAAGTSVEKLDSIAPDEFAKNGAGQDAILDVRKPTEYEDGHVAGAVNAPLDFFLRDS